MLPDRNSRRGHAAGKQILMSFMLCVTSVVYFHSIYTMMNGITEDETAFDGTTPNPDYNL